MISDIGNCYPPPGGWARRLDISPDNVRHILETFPIRTAPRTNEWGEWGALEIEYDGIWWELIGTKELDNWIFPPDVPGEKRSPQSREDWLKILAPIARLPEDMRKTIGGARLFRNCGHDGKGNWFAIIAGVSDG